MSYQLIDIQQNLTRDGSSITETYIVHYEAATSPITVNGATGVAIGDEHGTYSKHYCSSKNVSLIKGSAWDYQLEITYTGKGKTAAPRDPDNATSDPLNDGDLIQYTGNLSTETYFIDAENQPVINSAGQAFQELPSREVYHFGVVVSRYASSFSPATALTYSNTVNDANVTIDGYVYAAGTLKMGAISASKAYKEDGTEIYDITYPIQYNTTWKHKLNDMGLCENDDGLKPILDKFGNPVNQPVPLRYGSAVVDEDGNPDPDNMDVLEFEPYEAKDWSALSFS